MQERLKHSRPWNGRIQWTPGVYAWGLTLALCFLALTGEAAQLVLGQPTEADDLIGVPVVLDPNRNDAVASLQFDVNLNGSDLSLVDLELGAAAADGYKEAIFTETDGGFRVIIAGFNQETLGFGEVVTLWLAREGGGLDASDVTVSEAVLSDPNGDPVAVQVSSAESESTEGEKDDQPEAEKEVAETETDPELDQSSLSEEELSTAEETDDSTGWGYSGDGYLDAADASSSAGEKSAGVETGRSEALQARSQILTPPYSAGGRAGGSGLQLPGGALTPSSSRQSTPTGASPQRPALVRPPKYQADREGQPPTPAAPSTGQVGAAQDAPASRQHLALATLGRASQARGKAPATPAASLEAPGVRVTPGRRPIWLVLGIVLGLVPVITLLRRWLFEAGPCARPSRTHRS